MTIKRMKVRVQALRYEARDIISVELVPLIDEGLPPFTAGAHIDVHLPNGLSRSYSLINAQDDIARYVIAVLREDQGRGASRYIHAHLRCGEEIEISAPRNQFALDESAGASALVAGGIGITPILCMARRLCAIGRHVTVIYLARSRKDAAFVETLLSLAASAGVSITCHFTDEHQGRRFNIDQWLLMQPKGTHGYCCGPNTLIDAFEAGCAAALMENVHLERFHPVSDLGDADASDYTVTLARSGGTIHVKAGDTLLDTLLSAGVELDYSCREGICGACEVRIIAGQAVHHDSILSEEQRQANHLLYACVSHGACGGTAGNLVLDL